MSKFPMQFEVEAQGVAGMQTPWMSRAPGLPEFVCAIPKEFQGPGGGYSPEDLFGLTLVGCLIAIFKVYAEKSKASYEEIAGKATVTVDKDPSAQFLCMAKVDVTLTVQGAQDPEKIRKLLESSVKDCIVSNSIKSDKTFRFEVS